MHNITTAPVHAPVPLRLRMPILVNSRGCNQSTPDFKAIVGIAVSLLIYLGLNRSINNGTEALGSLTTAVACGFVSLAPLLFSESGRVLGGAKLITLLIGFYMLKSVASIAHYLIYIEPEYFSGKTDYVYFWDYMWLDQSLTYVSNIWNSHGLFSALSDEYWTENKNAGIIAFMSLNSYATGGLPLNIVPWNILSSIYSSVLIAEMVATSGANKSQTTFAMCIALLTPFTFIGSLMWRDTTGQFLIVLGAYLLFQTQSRKIYWIILVPIAAFLAYLDRQPYLAACIFSALACVAVDLVRKKQVPLAFVLMLVAAIAYLRYGQSLASVAFGRYGGSGESDMESMSSFSRIVGLPFRILRAIMGPFPWTQYFKHVDGYEYQPFDYLQTVVSLALLVIVVPSASRLLRDRATLDINIAFASTLFLMGVVSTGIHSSYIAVGLILLIPSASYVGQMQFRAAIGRSLVFFAIAHIVFIGGGFSGLNYAQTLSGGY